jgi:hypothetical protein
MTRTKITDLKRRLMRKLWRVVDNLILHDASLEPYSNSPYHSSLLPVLATIFRSACVIYEIYAEDYRLEYIQTGPGIRVLDYMGALSKPTTKFGAVK